MESITLGTLRSNVIYEAGIDGQTGTNGRHSPTNLNGLVNRFCREALLIVADGGQPWGQYLDDVTPIPAATAGEDFIEVDFPAEALEILGVDVQCNSGGSYVKWGELDAADWGQRRLLNYAHTRPDGGHGWWAVKQLPRARAASTVSVGKIALFPANLSGNYRITYREQFLDMTDDAHLFVGIVPMFTWVINSCVLVITKRDTNKKATFAAAQIEVKEAEARIRKASKRTQSAGAVTPTRRGGDLM